MMRIDASQAYSHTVAIEEAALICMTIRVGMKFLLEAFHGCHAAERWVVVSCVVISHFKASFHFFMYSLTSSS